MKQKATAMAAAVIAAVVSAPALGGYTITQGPTAPTYTGKTLMAGYARPDDPGR
jgi:hypothetical protein